MSGGFFGVRNRGGGAYNQACQDHFERVLEEYERDKEGRKNMHYKNGREAKNGDKVVLFPEYPKNAEGKSIGTPVVGILYDAVAGNDYCNGKIAIIAPNDPCPNLKEVLHVDDVLNALPEAVPDTSSPSD